METEDLVVDQGRQGKVIEEVCEVLPDVRVAILSQAFIVKAIDLGDLTRLVVATEDGDALWVSDLEGDKESDSLDGKVTSINIVTWALSAWPSCRL